MAVTRKPITSRKTPPTWPPRSCYQGASETDYHRFIALSARETDYHRFAALVVRHPEPVMSVPVSTGQPIWARGV